MPKIVVGDTNTDRNKKKKENFRVKFQETKYYSYLCTLLNKKSETMQAGECYVNRFDPSKVYKVLAIEGSKLHAEQCFCRPDGMEVSSFSSSMAYRTNDPQIRPETYERIKRQIEEALELCVDLVDGAETTHLLPYPNDMNQWEAEPQSGDYIIAYYEEVTTLYHVTKCNSNRVSGEYFQIDPTYVEHDRARAFDLPNLVMMIDETLYNKIPKVMQMTEAVVKALIKGDL